MSAIVGKRVTLEDSPDSPKLPRRAKSAAPFMYMHHPYRWQWVEESSEWLPLLGKLKVDPGVGGVQEGGGTDLAVAHHTRKGWQIIQPSDERLGPYRWYVQKIPKAGKGNVYCDATESVEVVGGRAFWAEGGEAYREFLRHLVGSGIISPLNDNVVKLKLEQQRRTVERMSSAAANAPHNQVLAARLEGAIKTLAAMERGAAPAPAKRGRPRKAVATEQAGA
mgnify:CR=1 FL=1